LLAFSAADLMVAACSFIPPAMLLPEIGCRDMRQCPWRILLLSICSFGHAGKNIREFANAYM